MTPTGKAIVVTGGTGALGTAVVKRLQDEGHRPAVTWLVEPEVAQLRRQVGPSPMAVRADVTDPASIQDALTQIRCHLGPIDALVHVVGAWAGGASVAEHSIDDWDRMLAVNLTSAFLCCRAVLPEMIERDRGRIVLVSSRTAHRDRAGQAGYAVAKAGVEVLAQTIAEETKEYDVTANVVAPSTVDTPANRASLSGADPSAWVSLETVAGAVSFLVDDSEGAMREATLSLYGRV